MSDGQSHPQGDLGLIKRLVETSIPFNSYLGLRCEEVRPGFAKLLIPFRHELVGDPMRPAIHGGVISALADTSCGAAVFTRLRPGDRCSTVDLRIDYLRPGLTEQDLRCEAEILRIGRAVAVISARVYQDSGENIAVARAAFMIRRADEPESSAS